MTKDFKKSGPLNLHFTCKPLVFLCIFPIVDAANCSEPSKTILLPKKAAESL